MTDDRSVPELIRDTIEASEYPELTVREVTQRTGLTEQQVYSAAGSMDRLELDQRVGVVRLPEDDGGDFVDDRDSELATDGGVDQAVGRREHPIMLGKRWGDEAESNIEKWGNQRHDTLLLALIEEVGEIAIAMEANSETIYDATSPDADDVPAAVGRRLIDDMADLGRETRDFLEGEYGDPAGDGESPDEHRIHGEPTDTTRILEEVEDTAPLCFQLYWALQGVDDGE
ncbi:hypothetical protein C471_09240 [Halorubrum saccharovorum DSM 1137]|uniref:Uncharacterized protein n=1 Tax=Halorubrum saccharovorum DSM 1137 TaxID=1227484 RepID=M0DVE2_9EURY|nr:hypothetical protein [Halorubrum saccharovorum]ELZ38798.1 hypothetical protein C471_09240 [Halorubrum saccharovorum DSM 1137]